MPCYNYDFSLLKCYTKMTEGVADVGIYSYS